MREENAIEEEVLAVVFGDGKAPCDIRGKKYKASGLNTHKAVHKKTQKKINKC